MVEYTYQDMVKMQEEAAVRVREMKRRAAIAVEDDEPEKNSIPDQVKRISYPVEITVSQNDENEESSGQDNSPQEILKADSDSVLILLILVLLSGEEADPMLSLALLYLLL
mgnify:CR=1 FL=1